MSGIINKIKWYTAGLHFECQECGQCCSGPEEGYIRVTRKEIKFIADYLKISTAALWDNYLRKAGLITSIREHPVTKDCVFLSKSGSKKGCIIYPVRPNQCRKWPFWASNLTNPTAWNSAAKRCRGINRGRLYTFEEIQRIKKSKGAEDNNG